MAQTLTETAHWLPAHQGQDLKHIPGEDGPPIIGTTFAQLRDPNGFAQRLIAKHGPVYRARSFGVRSVGLSGADANELVLMDRDKIFSSEQGWGPFLNRLFPRGLMLMDFDHHRADRRTLSVAFKPEPMRLYCEALNEGIARRTREWSGKSLAFYPAVKQLTLDLAATSFLGIPWGPEADKVNKAFVDMVQASVGMVRVPLPGTAMGRGVAGRKYLVEYFGKEVPKRRSGTAQDMFSQICRATDENGALLKDGQIVDHMNFLMMAAHDTITSSATTMIMLLGQHPEWQERLRDEMLGLGVNEDCFPYDRLSELVLTDYAFKESLRMIPPVPSLPRRALKPFSFGGYDFPAGTQIGIHPSLTHQMEEYWPNPGAFDPMRFEPEQVRKRHKYAWVPFGGGAHMCVGLHFAYMQIKLLMWHVLRNHRIEIGEGSGTKWQTWPISKPVDGLPITLVALAK